MCEICRQTPCHPSCPNARNEMSEIRCDRCGTQLLVGEDFFEDVEGMNLCEDCFYDFKEEKRSVAK